MDTRNKIWPLERLQTLLKSGKWTIAVGQFDPLTASQAKRLSALKADGGKLMVVVLEGDQALLPADARAVLLAALRAVDAVTVASAEDWSALRRSALGMRVVEDANAEEARSAEFVRFVVERQAVAMNGRGGS